MTYLTPELSKRNGNGNGDGRHGRRERDLAADLKKWLADLDTAEDLHREELRQIRKLRAEVYDVAKKRGVTPTMLRATRALLRK